MTRELKEQVRFEHPNGRRITTTSLRNKNDLPRVVAQGAPPFQENVPTPQSATFVVARVSYIFQGEKEAKPMQNRKEKLSVCAESNSVSSPA